MLGFVGHEQRCPAPPGAARARTPRHITPPAQLSLAASPAPAPAPPPSPAHPASARLLQARLQAYVQDGLLTPDEVASCSQTQIEFLIRKRTSPSATGATNSVVPAPPRRVSSSPRPPPAPAANGWGQSQQPQVRGVRTRYPAGLHARRHCWACMLQSPRCRAAARQLRTC